MACRKPISCGKKVTGAGQAETHSLPRPPPAPLRSSRHRQPPPAAMAVVCRPASPPRGLDQQELDTLGAKGLHHAAAHRLDQLIELGRGGGAAARGGAAAHAQPLQAPGPRGALGQDRVRQREAPVPVRAGLQKADLGRDPAEGHARGARDAPGLGSCGRLSTPVEDTGRRLALV